PAALPRLLHQDACGQRDGLRGCRFDPARPTSASARSVQRRSASTYCRLSAHHQPNRYARVGPCGAQRRCPGVGRAGRRDVMSTFHLAAPILLGILLATALAITRARSLFAAAMLGSLFSLVTAS